MTRLHLRVECWQGSKVSELKKVTMMVAESREGLSSNWELARNWVLREMAVKRALSGMGSTTWPPTTYVACHAFIFGICNLKCICSSSSSLYDMYLIAYLLYGFDKRQLYTSSEQNTMELF
jgi:hypothetical protein